MFFFNLEKNCFQSHESHQLSTNIRVLAHLFFHEKQMKPGLRTGNFIRLERQSKNHSDRQKLKISNKFLEKKVSKPIKS